MLKRHLARALLAAVLWAPALAAHAQTAAQPLHELHLPVPASRGSFGHFPSVGMSARDHFALRVAPDQSILVFDSDTSGQWPLVRVQNWGTDQPTTEVLRLPGWSASDTQHLDRIYVDVQTTPDERYAVAFSGAVWMRTSHFLLHVPKSYVARQPDTIITVVDLTTWQVVNSMHTAALNDVAVRDVRVTSNGWLAFDGPFNAPLSQRGTYPYRAQLLSIPGLKPGPGCHVEVFSHFGRPPSQTILNAVLSQNDSACRNVLNASGTDTTNDLLTRIRTGRSTEPTALKLQGVSWRTENTDPQKQAPLSQSQRLWQAETDADQFFRHWGEYPYYALYWQNPPFQGSSGAWYGLYPASDSGFYQLGRFDSQGKQQAAETARSLLCGDPALGHPKSACGCRVVDVAEQSHTLLTYCRQQRGDFDGMVEKQWLATFHSDDLSATERIDLPKGSEALVALAEDTNQGYALTLEWGEVLKVHAIPRSQKAPAE